MKVDKLSISLDPDLGDSVRAAARGRGSSLSAWLADAATAKLRAEALSDYLDDWEATHEPLSPEELDVAAADLGVRSPRSADAA